LKDVLRVRILADTHPSERHPLDFVLRYGPAGSGRGVEDDESFHRDRFCARGRRQRRKARPG
jgi:hypothetical protein